MEDSSTFYVVGYVNDDGNISKNNSKVFNDIQSARNEERLMRIKMLTEGYHIDTRIDVYEGRRIMKIESTK